MISKRNCGFLFLASLVAFPVTASAKSADEKAAIAPEVNPGHRNAMASSVSEGNQDATVATAPVYRDDRNERLLVALCDDARTRQARPYLSPRIKAPERGTTYVGGKASINPIEFLGPENFSRTAGFRDPGGERGTGRFVPVDASATEKHPLTLLDEELGREIDALWAKELAKTKPGEATCAACDFGCTAANRLLPPDSFMGDTLRTKCLLQVQLQDVLESDPASWKLVSKDPARFDVKSPPKPRGDRTPFPGETPLEFQLEFHPVAGGYEARLSGWNKDGQALALCPKDSEKHRLTTRPFDPAELKFAELEVLFAKFPGDPAKREKQLEGWMEDMAEQGLTLSPSKLEERERQIRLEELKDSLAKNPSEAQKVLTETQRQAFAKQAQDFRDLRGRIGGLPPEAKGLEEILGSLSPTPKFRLEDHLSLDPDSETGETTTYSLQALWEHGNETGHIKVTDDGTYEINLEKPRPNAGGSLLGWNIFKHPDGSLEVIPKIHHSYTGFE